MTGARLLIRGGGGGYCHIRLYRYVIIIIIIITFINIRQIYIILKNVTAVKGMVFKQFTLG